MIGAEQDCRPLVANEGPRIGLARGLLLVSLLTAKPMALSAQVADVQERDRGGSGVPSSQFATFVEAGELAVYAYYEYYRDKDAEYKPSELGYTGDVDYFGRFTGHEGLLFLGYGFTSRLLLEPEAALISSGHQEKAGNDTSDFPDAGVRESGLGDVESQLRYRWHEETDTSPEIFSYFETVFPFQRDHTLIGTSSWEFQYGMSVARSFALGTIVLRGSVAWAEGSPEIGEYAAEYVRGVSNRLGLYGAVEGSEDEVELITEAQIFMTPAIKPKLNNAVGLTKKAAGWAPEVGMMFVF